MLWQRGGLLPHLLSASAQRAAVLVSRFLQLLFADILNMGTRLTHTIHSSLWRSSFWRATSIMSDLIFDFSQAAMLIRIIRRLHLASGSTPVHSSSDEMRALVYASVAMRGWCIPGRGNIGTSRMWGCTFGGRYCGLLCQAHVPAAGRSQVPMNSLT